MNVYGCVYEITTFTISRRAMVESGQSFCSCWLVTLSVTQALELVSWFNNECGSCCELVLSMPCYRSDTRPARPDQVSRKNTKNQYTRGNCYELQVSWHCSSQRLHWTEGCCNTSRVFGQPSRNQPGNSRVRQDI